MAADQQTSARKPRLNPFAFPSDTDFRFVLLIVMVLGSSMFIYNWLYMGMPGSKVWVNASLKCQELYPNPEDIDIGNWRKDPTDFGNRVTAASRCLAEANKPIAIWMISGTALLIGLAGIIYWMWPVLKIKRQGLVPLSAEDSPDMIAYLNDLCHEIGLFHPPIFLLDASNLGISGLTFGRKGRYYLAIPGGLVVMFTTDRPAFRAIMLHELAHLRNADVTKTYFTLAIWWAFVVVALVPFAVTSFDEGISWIINMVWRVFILALLVYLTRNAVLRSREVYADVRASAWDGPSGSLGRMLERLPRPKMGSWRSMLQVHPDPAERLHALEDTHHLFNMGFWDALGTGIAAMIAFSSISDFLNKLNLSSIEFYGRAWIITGLIVAPLVAGIVGLGVWRSIFASLARAEKPQGTARLGLALSLGVVLGNFISLNSSTIFFEYGPLGWISFLGSNIIMGIFLIIILTLFLKWVMVGASGWLEVATTSRSLRFTYLAGLFMASGFLTIFFGLYFSSNSFSGDFLMGISTISEAITWALLPVEMLFFNALLIFPQSLIFLMFTSLWAFPLAAWFYRKRLVSASGSSWAFLDPTFQQLTFPRQAPLRIGLALNIGLKGGLLFCILLLIIRTIIHVSVPETITNTDEYKLILYFLVNLTPAVLIQAGVAAFTTSRIERLGTLHGLFAAFVTGCIMVAGILGINLLFGGGIDLNFAWMVFSQVVNSGALIALVIMYLFSSVNAWRIRRRGISISE